MDGKPTMSAILTLMSSLSTVVGTERRLIEMGWWREDSMCIKSVFQQVINGRIEIRCCCKPQRWPVKNKPFHTFSKASQNTQEYIEKNEYTQQHWKCSHSQYNVRILKKLY